MTHALLTHARGLVPELAEAAPRHEAARRVDPELSARLGREGYYRMLVPASRGGLEVTTDVYVRALETLAEGDAATAWCVMTGATTGLLAAYLPAEGAARLMLDPNVALAGVFAPMGKATPVEGGYRVRGRWPFCSGGENAAWRTGGALVMGEAGPRKTASGAPEVRSMFFSAADSTLVDTWNVAGLSGTGSHDLVVDDVFVPECLTAVLSEDRPAQGATAPLPPFAVLALGVGAVALGVARAALDACTAQAKAPRRGGATRASDSHVQIELARAEAELRAARAFVLQAIAEVREHDTISLRDRALLRMAASHAVRAATSVVDVAYALGGGAAIYRDNPLQRHSRDAHTITQHVMVAPGASKLAGRAWLGVEGDFAML